MSGIQSDLLRAMLEPQIKKSTLFSSVGSAASEAEALSSLQQPWVWVLTCDPLLHVATPFSHPVPCHFFSCSTNKSQIKAKKYIFLKRSTEFPRTSRSRTAHLGIHRKWCKKNQTWKAFKWSLYHLCVPLRCTLTNKQMTDRQNGEVYWLTHPTTLTTCLLLSPLH